MRTLPVKQPSWKLGAIALVALLYAGGASALDGRIEIDTAPYTISQSGSYVLTSNLSVPANTTAITVSADYVTIDLNGFRILGGASCSWTDPTVTCTGSTSGSAISSSNEGIIVRNGKVENFAGIGIQLGEGSRVEDVFMHGVGSHGIDLGNGGVVLRNRLVVIGGDGARCGRACRFADNTVTWTEDSGLWSNYGRALFRDNTISQAQNRGIEIDSAGSPRGALVHGNSITDTGSDGMMLYGPSGIYENSVVRSGRYGVLSFEHGSLINRNSVNFSALAGIIAGTHSLVMENSSKDNGGYGITENGGSTIACGNNVMNFNNSSGTQWADCVTIGNNVCKGSTVCP
jgi:hypothetical protein